MADIFRAALYWWYGTNTTPQKQSPAEDNQEEEQPSQVFSIDDPVPEGEESVLSIIPGGVSALGALPVSESAQVEHQNFEPQQVSLEDSNMANYGGKEMRDLRHAAAMTEKEFVGAGTKVGLEIWRVENEPGKFGVRRWPSNQYGEFFSGDSYIVLNTYKVADSESLHHDLHFWLGKSSSQDEIGVAAYKTVELDDLLNDLPIQHREVQGHESALFRSYFSKSGIMFMEGGHASGFRHVKHEDFGNYKRLFMIKREIKGWKVKTALSFEIPCQASNMNHGDVFVLDLGSKVYIWIGKEASSFERFEGNLIVNNIINSRNGRARKALVDDLFWEALNGAETDVRSAENPYQVDMEGEDWLDNEKVKLFRVSDASGSVKFTLEAKGKVSMSSLDSNDVFLVHANVGIWIWEGSKSSRQEKDKAFLIANSYIKENNLPQYLPVTKIREAQVKYSPLFHALFTEKAK